MMPARNATDELLASAPGAGSDSETDPALCCLR